MKDKVVKVGIILAIIAGIYIYFQQRAYIGYFLAALAIPYGAYGMFVPYKSAQEYAKKGYAGLYSRQLGWLIISLGILGILFSMKYAEVMQSTKLLIALMLYMILFFATLYILNKRYMNKPQD